MKEFWFFSWENGTKGSEEFFANHKELLKRVQKAMEKKEPFTVYVAECIMDMSCNWWELHEKE